MKKYGLAFALALLPVAWVGCVNNNVDLKSSSSSVAAGVSSVVNVSSSSSVAIGMSLVVNSSSSLGAVSSMMSASSMFVSSAPVSSVVSSSSAISYGSFVDSRDNKTYKTVVIGAQTWMAENLNYNPTTGNSQCYGDNSANCTTYGRLYDWATAMAGETTSSANPSGVQGVCPVGWHLPSAVEWSQLIKYVDINNGNDGLGKSLKSNSRLWYNNTGTNSFGFSALPAGELNKESYNYLGQDAYFWGSTESDQYNVSRTHLSGFGDYFGSSYESKFVKTLFGKYDTKIMYTYSSVRCLKN